MERPIASQEFGSYPMTNGGGHHLAKPAKSSPAKAATKPKTSGARKKAMAEAKRT